MSLANAPSQYFRYFMRRHRYFNATAAIQKYKLQILEHLQQLLKQKL